MRAASGLADGKTKMHLSVGQRKHDRQHIVLPVVDGEDPHDGEALIELDEATEHDLLIQALYFEFRETWQASEDAESEFLVTLLSVQRTAANRGTFAEAFSGVPKTEAAETCCRLRGMLLSLPLLAGGAAVCSI